MNEYMIVLTKVKKFKRKFYSKKLNRSFPFDGVLYAIGFGVGMYLLRHMPGLYIFFIWIPFMIAYLVIPVGLAYLLTGIPTEGRKPILYFRSYCHYWYRQFRKKNHWRGKEVNKPMNYKIKGLMQYQDGRKKPALFKGRHYKSKGYFTYKKG